MPALDDGAQPSDLEAAVGPPRLAARVREQPMTPVLMRSAPRGVAPTPGEVSPPPPRARYNATAAPMYGDIRRLRISLLRDAGADSRPQLLADTSLR